MIRRPPRSTLSSSSAASDVYKRQVNSMTNKIYVADWCGNDPNCTSGGTVTVIDGATDNTLSVNVGFNPYGVAVNSMTNKIYVANWCGNCLLYTSPSPRDGLLSRMP